MEHYVTYFDSLFLPQGLVLHKSMERHAGEYMLWMLCIDDEAYNVLKKLELPNVKLLELKILETDRLREVKKDRTKGEYCWTLTPFTVKFVFDADASVNRVTYVDSDIWFRKNPYPIFKEFNESEKDVLITDHSFAAEWDQSTLYGQFCVQFMIFNRTDNAEIVRKWWEDRCIEWCYNKTVDGKFGDQKYLDDWPTRFFNSVHVLINKELMLAPWNATRFPYGNSILWHFHGLRLSGTTPKVSIYYGGYPIPNQTKDYVYKPYIIDLVDAINTLESTNHKVRSQLGFRTGILVRIKSIIKGIYQQIWRINIYSNKPINYI